MPGPSHSLDVVVEEAVRSAIAQTAPHLARLIAARAAAALESDLQEELGSSKPVQRRRSPRRAHPTRQKRSEITRWVADKQARRVPLFVIDLTGLDTKKQIVARYGEGARFVMGEPLPAQCAEPSESAESLEGEEGAAGSASVRARPPVIRKAVAQK